MLHKAAGNYRSYSWKYGKSGQNGVQLSKRMRTDHTRHLLFLRLDEPLNGAGAFQSLQQSGHWYQKGLSFKRVFY